MTSTEILKKYFGYDSFRSGQKTIIDSILDGKDCLGIMPTGAGKSICFQIPALMLDGVTLVISPLISLMKDQVNSLTQSGIPAAFINSSLTQKQIFLVYNRIREGKYKLIYIAPERLMTPDFLELAKSIKISMVTVDEAHCISQWGQDFRPSYSKISEFIGELTIRPVVSAFTATATPRVREDILKLLELREPKLLVTGFDRENLYFEVRRPKKKLDELLSFLSDKKDRSGIIYCKTRKNVESIYEKLLEKGYSVSKYHAGLEDGQRKENQDDFLYDRALIMVATNAFGMGIDKSNVSFVVHYNMPSDIESYYQEAGRAGRDGEKADCLLLYSGQDVQTSLWMIENSNDKEYSDPKTEQLIRERDRKRLNEMTLYCTTNECLRNYILKYFGEAPIGECGNCSNCNEEYQTKDVTVESQKILSCIYRTSERFGGKMIIDILRGSKSERIIKLKLDSLPTYNIMTESEATLREIIDYLILNKYIIKTDDKYPVLKLGAGARNILNNSEKLTIRVAAYNKRADERMKKTVANEELFSLLRAKRFELAKEQNVPSYVVFSDSALMDMCLRLPTNDDEMLCVSGVGQAKLERYGKIFLDIIGGFMATHPETENISVDVKPNDINVSEIEISDTAVTVSAIADRIKTMQIRTNMPFASSIRINRWLVKEGYLTEKMISESKFKVPTPKGINLGISSSERVIRGQKAYVNLFSREAQQFVIDNLERM